MYLNIQKYKFIFINFVSLYIKLCKFIYCRFYYLNSICNIEYFIEICQISELPSIFNFVTSMMSFQLNIYYISRILRNYIVLGMHLTFIYHFFYFAFTPLSFTFLLLEYNSNNRKTVLSLERTKYQPRTKERSFSNKSKSHHFSFTTCFIT